jgi:putative endonuclease
MMAGRRRAELWGRRAETLAAWWLRLKGYRILARRVRTPVGEVDIVARRGRTLVFVEVKARLDVATAAEALTYVNRRRIARAANALLARFGTGCEAARIDAVLMAPWRLPHHIVGAWVGE